MEEIRDTAAEDRFDAELRPGRYAEVLADLETAGAERQLSERLTGLRIHLVAHLVARARASVMFSSSPRPNSASKPAAPSASRASAVTRSTSRRSAGGSGASTEAREAAAAPSRRAESP
ncbi:hypothetical protein ACFVSQ_33295 [Streptomyces niveus]|uniref:hypothetical protein n=1 Tax=Streptomyces niveus TaxID=193462 RepID=UPI0036E5B53E